MIDVGGSSSLWVMLPGPSGPGSLKKKRGRKATKSKLACSIPPRPLHQLLSVAPASSSAFFFSDGV